MPKLAERKFPMLYLGLRNVISMPLSVLLPASTTPQTPQSKDDVKKESERLFTELDTLTREYKRLRQVVEQLGREYEESKDYDPVRRYEKLKGMVKRTIMHLRVNQEEQGASPAGATGGTGLVQGCKEYAFQMESLKKREEHFSGKTVTRICMALILFKTFAEKFPLMFK